MTSRPNFSVDYFAPVHGAASTGSKGIAVIGHSDGSGRLVVATAANRSGGRRSIGIALVDFDSDDCISIQEVGQVDRSVVNLGVGTDSYVRVSTTGTLERVDVPDVAVDDVIGHCDTAGNIFLTPFAKLSATSGANAQQFQGRALSAAVPLVGTTYSYNGTTWIPTRQVLTPEMFGAVADADFAGGGTPCAAAFEAMIEAITNPDDIQAALCELAPTPGTGYRIERPIQIKRSCILYGHGGDLYGASTVLVPDAGKTCLRVSGAGVSGSPSGSPGVVLADFAIRSSGQVNTTTTGDYTVVGFTITNVASNTSFSVGDNIAIEGVGPQCSLAKCFGSVTSGSPTVTLTSTGDQTPVLRAGMYIKLGAAYPNPTKITNRVGLTLTMESNAAASVSGGQVYYCAPLVARIMNIVGNTWTIDCAESVVSKTGAEIKHYTCGVDALNRVSISGVSVGDLSGHHVNGAAFAIRGDRANVPASTGANLSTIDNCQAQGNRTAVLLFGTDSNACRVRCLAHGHTDWSLVDFSHLGSKWTACHSDGGNGYLGYPSTNCRSTYEGCYMEAGTYASLSPGAMINGGNMPFECNGFNVQLLSPEFTIPLYPAGALADTTYTAYSGEYYSPAVEWSGTAGADYTITWPAQSFPQPKLLENRTDKTQTHTTGLGTSITLPPDYAVFAIVTGGGVNVRPVSPMWRVTNTTPTLLNEVLSITQNSTSDRTLTAAEAICSQIEISGTPGGAFNIIAPTNTGAVRCVVNNTASACTIKKSGGTGVTIAANRTAWVRYDSAGADYKRTTADVAH